MLARQLAPEIHSPLFDGLRAADAEKAAVDACYDVMTATASADGTPEHMPQMELVAAGGETVSGEAAGGGEAAVEAVAGVEAAEAHLRGIDICLETELAADANHEEVERQGEASPTPSPQLTRSMRRLVDTLYGALHDAALKRRDGLAPYVDWLLHHSTILLLTDAELQGLMPDSLLAQMSEAEQREVLAEASGRLNAARSTIVWPTAPNALPDETALEPPATAALERMAKQFEVALHSLVAKLLVAQHQLNVAEQKPSLAGGDDVTGYTGDALPILALPGAETAKLADDEELAPIVALEVSHSSTDGAVLRSRGFEEVTAEGSAPGSLLGASLWLKRGVGSANKSVRDVNPLGGTMALAALPPIAEVRVTSGSRAHKQQLAAAGGWVLLPRSLAVADSTLRLWYRRCQPGDAPLRHMSFVSPKALAKGAAPVHGPPAVERAPLSVSGVDLRAGAGGSMSFLWRTTPCSLHLAFGA